MSAPWESKKNISKKIERNGIKSISPKGAKFKPKLAVVSHHRILAL